MGVFKTIGRGAEGIRDHPVISSAVAAGSLALLSYVSFAGASHDGVLRTQELAAARQAASISVQYLGHAATLASEARKAHDQGHEGTAYDDMAASNADMGKSLGGAETAANDAGAADGDLNNREGAIEVGTIEAALGFVSFVGAGGFAMQAYNRRGRP